MELEKFDGAGTHFLRIDPAIVDGFAALGTRRVIADFGNGIETHCAFNPLKTGGHFIFMAMPLCKKLGIRAGSEVAVAFRVDDSSDIQFPVPEELIEVLASDPEAEAVFAPLTDGQKRSLAYLVIAVKSTDKRIERSLKIAENLKRGITSRWDILK